MRRAMQKFVEGPLSVQLLKGGFKAGDCVIIDAKADNMGLEFSKAACADEEAVPVPTGAVSIDGRVTVASSEIDVPSVMTPDAPPIVTQDIEVEQAKDA